VVACSPVPVPVLETPRKSGADTGRGRWSNSRPPLERRCRPTARDIAPPPGTPPP
jgi:hypothetical protein